MRKSKLTLPLRATGALLIPMLLSACAGAAPVAPGDTASFSGIDYTNALVTGTAPAKYTRTIFSSMNF